MDTIRFDEAIEELEKEIIKVKSINEMYGQIDQIRESIEKDFLPKINSIEGQINVKEQNLCEEIKVKSSQLLEQADKNTEKIKVALDDLQTAFLAEQKNSADTIKNKIDELSESLIEQKQLVTEIKNDIALLEKHLSAQDGMMGEHKECMVSLQEMIEKQFKSNKILHAVSIVAIIVAIVCVVLA